MKVTTPPSSHCATAEMGGVAGLLMRPKSGPFIDDPTNVDETGVQLSIAFPPGHPMCPAFQALQEPTVLDNLRRQSQHLPDPQSLNQVISSLQQLGTLTTSTTPNQQSEAQSTLLHIQFQQVSRVFQLMMKVAKAFSLYMWGRHTSTFPGTVSPAAVKAFLEGA